MVKTKLDAELAEAERAHGNDPERAELIARTRRFKASWLELAEALMHVRKNDTWKGWGFESFEQYASRELRLRQETVDKLTGSYSFLQRRAPAVLQRDGVVDAIPSYQAVDFLRRAEEREDAPQEAVVEIRKKVLDEGVPLPSVAREYRDVVFPIDDETKDKREKAALKLAATRLRDMLASSRAVSQRLAGDVTEKLDELIVALADSKKRAA